MNAREVLVDAYGVEDADDTLGLLAEAGLVVVPKVPTSKMIEDVTRIDRVVVGPDGKRVNGTDRCRLIAREVWEVMLAAAPKVEEGGA